jgi:hypothetical protein
MRKYRPLSLVLFLAAAFAAAAQPFTAETPPFPSARLAAMGGTHAALADDISVLFVNPAGFRSVRPQFAVAELSANLSGPVFSIADLVLRITGGANPLSLLADPSVQSLLTSLYASAIVNGPLSFGYVGDGLGFGFFNSSGLAFSTQGTVPTLSASLGENLAFVGGYAFRIPLPDAWKSTLDLGVSVKAMASGRIALSESILGVFSLLASPSANLLLSQPFVLDVGFGLDAGVLYSWNSILSVGIVGRDLYAPVVRNTYASLTGFTSGATPVLGYGLAPIDLSAGVVFTPPLGALSSYLSDLKVALDYSDILDFLTHPSTAANPVLHVGLGAEVVLLDILALRAGFGDGYFSAGLGLNLTVFRLNLTMYGSELSSEPGLRPAYNLLVGFEFRY